MVLRHAFRGALTGLIGTLRRQEPMRSLVVCFASSVLCGCAASGPIFTPATPPSADKAMLYLYRPGTQMLSGRDVYFYIQDKNVADLTAEGYTVLYLDPGTYTLKQTWPWDMVDFEPLEVPLVMEAGKTHYWRFYTGGEPSGMGVAYQWYLEQVTEAAAMPDLSRCHYQPPNDTD